MSSYLERFLVKGADGLCSIVRVVTHLDQGTHYTKRVEYQTLDGYPLDADSWDLEEWDEIPGEQIE